MSLAEGLQKEVSRNQELLAQYAEFHNTPGVFVGFAEAMIKADLDFATKAMLEGDIVAMVQAYERLKGNE